MPESVDPTTPPPRATGHRRNTILGVAVPLFLGAKFQCLIFLDPNRGRDRSSGVVLSRTGLARY